MPKRRVEVSVLDPYPSHEDYERDMINTDTSTRLPLSHKRLFPGAGDAHLFWKNILDSRDFIADIPADHWLIEDYYDPDAGKAGKTYAKRGAFLSGVAF